MPKPIFTLLSLVIIAGIAASDAQAGIYKCVGADGGVTYSQTPCPGQKTETIQASARPSGKNAIDCSHANRFALNTAKTMRTGTTSAQVFERYGGLDSLSKGTLGIINYVYGFRSNDDVSVERIAALTHAKCQAKSFGDVSCEALPLSYSESLGGCDVDDQDADEPGVSTLTTAPAASVHSNTLSQQSINNNSRAANAEAKAREEQRRKLCKESKRKAIDAINQRMRSAYSSAQGESYRERLRELREQLRDC